MKALRLLPLYLALPYLFITWALFLFGPYVWPVREWWAIYAFVPVCFLVLAAGFLFGVRGEPRSSGMPSAKAMFYIGALAAILLLTPSTLTYTGKMPWDLSKSIADQREAYSALAEQLAATQGSRGPVAALRALFGPFVFCVLPLAVLLRKTLTKLDVALTIATVAASIIFSVQRGTTSQLADIFIVGLSAYLVYVAATEGSVSGIALHWKAIVASGILLALILTVLVGRTEARLGGQRIACLANSGACADLSSGAYGHMSDTLAFGSAAISGYFSQGYYGVALAAEKDFEPTWGIGHSPAASAMFVTLGGSETLPNRAYTARARGDGWSDETQWSSLITWLANDLSLWGAPLALAGIGWLWGRSWIDAAIGGDISAAVFFCVLAMVVFYLPANNYVMATYDGYATLLFWWAVWGIRRRRIRA